MKSSFRFLSLEWVVGNFFLLKLIPGTNPAIFEALYQMGYKGVVVEAFGIGGIHFKKRDLADAIGNVIAKGMTVVVGTQCLYEGSNLSIYQTGQVILKQGAIAAHDKIAKIQDMMKQEQYADETSQEMLGQWLEAAEKEAAYMDDNMQKLYGAYIGNFQGYLEDINLAVTDVGSKGERLALTKTRVSNQQETFEKLKSTNENRDLSEIIIDYTSAYTAYQASLMASSKANQQTLLNYI